jgi:hypothetical protein
MNYTKNLIKTAEQTVKGNTKTVSGGMARGGGGGVIRGVDRTNNRPIEPSRPVGGGLSVGKEMSNDERIRQLMDKGMSEEKATQLVLNPTE